MGLSTPILKCLEGEVVRHTLTVVHKGILKKHFGTRDLAKKFLTAMYYWLSMVRDDKDCANNCDQCQRHEDIYNANSSELHMLTSSWSFSQ